MSQDDICLFPYKRCSLQYSMVAGVHCVHGPKGRETGASTRRDPGIRTMYIQRGWGTQGPEAVCANTKYPVILYPVIRIWQMKRPVTWVSKNYLQFLHRILEAIFCGHSAQVLTHFYTRKVDSEGIALLKTQNFCVLHKLNSEGGSTRKKVRSDKKQNKLLLWFR